MGKAYFAYYQCKWCEERISIEFNPEYNPSGFPVLIEEKPEPRWGGVDSVRQHLCGTSKQSDGEISRYGVAELIGWKTLEVTENEDGDG